MIWRKHYRSMYEGSMVGAGAVVFALMGYVISHQDYDRATNQWFVRLNPMLLGTVLGEKPEDVEKAIHFLCKEDKNSTSKIEHGRRIVPIGNGTMEYRVVNGEKYQEMRQYEERKEYNREMQKKYRQRTKEQLAKQGPLPGEIENLSIAKSHGQDAADAHFDKREKSGWKL